MDEPEAPVDLASLNESMLAAQQSLFATAHPETAYHALATALHCAADAGDASALRQIEAVAAHQRQRLLARITPVTAMESSGIEVAPSGRPERIYHSAIQQARRRAVTIELRGAIRP